MFTKTLTAGVLAMSLSITSLAPTPAQAAFSEEDAIVGIITLLLFGAAIHHSRDDDSPDHPDRPVLPRVDRDAHVTLPDRCLRQDVRRGGHPVRYFGQRCMKANYTFVQRLPNRCQIRFRNQFDQHRAGWDARCLRDEGFRFTRH